MILTEERASPENRDARRVSTESLVLVGQGLAALVLAGHHVRGIRNTLTLAGILALAGAGVALAGALALAGVGAGALHLSTRGRRHEARGSENRDRCGDHGLLRHVAFSLEEFRIDDRSGSDDPNGGEQIPTGGFTHTSLNGRDFYQSFAAPNLIGRKNAQMSSTGSERQYCLLKDLAGPSGGEPWTSGE